MADMRRFMARADVLIPGAGLCFFGGVSLLVVAAAILPLLGTRTSMTDLLVYLPGTVYWSSLGTGVALLNATACALLVTVRRWGRLAAAAVLSIDLVWFGVPTAWAMSSHDPRYENLAAVARTVIVATLLPLLYMLARGIGALLRKLSPTDAQNRGEPGDTPDSSPPSTKTPAR